MRHKTFLLIIGVFFILGLSGCGTTDNDVNITTLPEVSAATPPSPTPTASPAATPVPTPEPTLPPPPPMPTRAPETPRDFLQDRIHFAMNRLTQAKTPGAVVSMGRWHQADINILDAAIQSALASLDENMTMAQANAAWEPLQRAVQDFNEAIIDPRGDYRPFLDYIALGEDVPQIRSMRGAWLSTVMGIDWPSAAARGTTPAHVDRQKAELRLRFEEIAGLGYNAVIFQISPTGDAMFRSELSPWSAWLTGETNFVGELIDSQGNIFDPLQYAVELSREMNLELHAWLNPYRITHRPISYTRAGIINSSTGQPVTSLNDIRQEWSNIPGTAFYLFDEYVHLGDGWMVIDPGRPGSRQWVVDRVIEVITNYDIDAIHFDDYFYPEDFNDRQTFLTHNTAENNKISGIVFPDTPQGRNDWRRENTTMMIRDVRDAIREHAPWIKFGVSPGGVWRSSAEGNTGLDGGGFNAGTGSASTTSWSNFNSSWADTRKWVIENYIDYLTPQVYWDFNSPTAPFGIISEWWGRLVHDFGPDGSKRNSQGEYTTTQMFIGLGLYRMEGNPPAKWNNNNENEGTRTYLRQEAFVLGNPNISGSMAFTQNQMRPGRENGLWETMLELNATLWRYPALIPAMPHMGGIAPTAPRNVVVSGSTISWENTELSTSPFQAPRYFVIYRDDYFDVDLNNPANIVAIVPAVPGQVYYTFTADSHLGSGHFVVTAVNRLHDQSDAGR